LKPPTSLWLGALLDIRATLLETLGSSRWKQPRAARVSCEPLNRLNRCHICHGRVSESCGGCSIGCDVGAGWDSAVCHRALAWRATWR
jgi:hypothetical protein